MTAAAQRAEYAALRIAGRAQPDSRPRPVVRIARHCTEVCACPGPWAVFIRFGDKWTYFNEYESQPVARDEALKYVRTQRILAISDAVITE